MTSVRQIKRLSAMASEEMDEIYEIPSQYPRGKYLLTFDPLDGSSNTDVNVSVGTIFDLKPRDLHQRVPAILGSSAEVERVVSYHAE